MISLLIGLPFNQLSSVSSVSAGIENIGGVYADGSDVESSCGSRQICLPSSLETWAADASGAVDGLDEHYGVSRFFGVFVLLKPNIANLLLCVKDGNEKKSVLFL